MTKVTKSEFNNDGERKDVGKTSNKKILHKIFFVRFLQFKKKIKTKHEKQISIICTLLWELNGTKDALKYCAL